MNITIIMNWEKVGILKTIHHLPRDTEEMFKRLFAEPVPMWHSDWMCSRYNAGYFLLQSSVEIDVLNHLCFLCNITWLSFFTILS
jgi:hypothetical protein